MAGLGTADRSCCGVLVMVSDHPSGLSDQSPQAPATTAGFPGTPSALFNIKRCWVCMRSAAEPAQTGTDYESVEQDPIATRIKMRIPMGYQLRCTLSYGDIYGQIMVWLSLTFLSLAAAAALGAAGHPIAGVAVISLILAFSLPFLLFSFTTTLISHLVIDQQAQHQPALAPPETF
jgi:hypothetical protein